LSFLLHRYVIHYNEVKKETKVNRREFSKSGLMLGMGVLAGSAKGYPLRTKNQPGNFYEEPAKKLPIRKFDVVVAGGGTAGVVAATAAAR